MLKGQLLHPAILDALARAGHGSQVLIADSNYPFETVCGPNAAVVYLNLAPGVVDGVQALRAIAGAIPVEGAVAMRPDTGETPTIIASYQAVLGAAPPIGFVSRQEFYDLVRSPDTALVVATGEQRLYACLLLTVGVVTA